ncbi:putative membrane protein YczE [Alkalihalobacillus xiaoxiensis]|uniref:Membrane protein YczE n=1 Tax=Shouchella xiaoxiensis TaxID=766895 RepID=A0ABS2SQQ7_9BACI|nr:DUF6198 family protein [Shouchella xiaoxiensis]MBM7837838.1 putative membrane protein YczE [Shouchella xiaoxiensis]
MKLTQRYLFFTIGLFFMGLGISLTAKSELGNSPISSVPYVLSLAFPLTLGAFTFLLMALFVLIQWGILGRHFPPLQWIQLALAPILGVFIDFGLLLASFIHPNLFIEKLAVLILGCVFIAIGVYIQVEAKTVMNAGEAIIKVLSQKTKIEFGTMKIIFDWSLVAISTMLSLAFFGGLHGIGVGTIISAFLVGFLIKALRKFLGVNRFQSSKKINP